MSEELCWGCAGIGTSIICSGLGAGPVIIAGSDEQKRTWLLAADRGAAALLVRADRARRRLGRRPHEVDGSAEGRRVRPQRLEDVHHERGPRSLDRRLREDRPRRGPSRHLRLRRADGHAGRDDREAPRQDGPARDGHVGVLASPTPSSRQRTGSARRATASRSPCRRSTRRGPARRSAPSASLRRRTSTRPRTRRSA